MSKYAPDVAFGTFSLMGLVRAEVLVEGMRRAGPDLRRLRLILALEGMDNWSDNILGHRPIQQGQPQGLDSVRLMKVEGGKYHPVTGVEALTGRGTAATGPEPVARSHADDTLWDPR
jgi:hypothetical protein